MSGKNTETKKTIGKILIANKNTRKKSVAKKGGKILEYLI